MCECQKLIPELRLDSLMCWALVVISSTWGLLEWKPVWGIEAIIVWIPFFLQYFNHRRCSKQCYKHIPGSFDSACEPKMVWIAFVFCKFAIEPQSVDVVSFRWIWAPKLTKFDLNGRLFLWWPKWKYSDLLVFGNRRKNQRSDANICMGHFWVWSLQTYFVSSSFPVIAIWAATFPDGKRLAL